MKRYCVIWLLCLVFVNAYSYSDTTKILLIIDAGHGGKDPGNLASCQSCAQEKDLNLTIALKFGEYVEGFLGHAVHVIYTRKDDTFIELQERINIANSKQAHYFISIHCNSSKNPDAIGTETHINTLENKASLDLAHAIQREFFTRGGRISRGVKLKEDRLYNLMVLKYTNMTSVLVESGFMTNAEEEAFLNTEHGQDIIASSVYRAFKDFVALKHGIEQRTPPNNMALRPKFVGTVYKIQVYTSAEPVSTDTEAFKKLNYPIEEIRTETNGENIYRYFVGEFATQREAKKELKDIQKLAPFKFAFVVKVE